jgi:hypothetical protein
MKKPCIFVQNNYVTRVTAPVAIFARANGIELIDRSCMAGFDPDQLGIDWSTWDPILPVGSVQFMRAAKRSVSLSKYIQHDEEKFSYPRCINELGLEMLNSDGMLVTAAAVPELLVSGKWHVRPSQVDKAFTATLFDSDGWSAMHAKKPVDDELLCWASPAKQIFGEWRTWTVDGRVIEISRYRDEHGMRRDLDVPHAVRRYADEVAAVWQPAPVTVMDIALTGEGLRVIEFNPVNGSGFYAGRVDIIIPAWLAWATEHAARREAAADVGAPPHRSQNHRPG